MGIGTAVRTREVTLVRLAHGTDPPGASQGARPRPSGRARSGAPGESAGSRLARRGAERGAYTV